MPAYELASAGPGEPTHGDWRLVVEAGGKDCVRVPPFADLDLDLAALWV